MGVPLGHEGFFRTFKKSFIKNASRKESFTKETFYYAHSLIAGFLSASHSQESQLFLSFQIL